MIKAFLGYDLAPGVTAAAYDDWLWRVHVPDRLANPHLDRLVIGTVRKVVRGTETFFRIAERHHRDLDAFARYEAWNAAHPLPPERGAAGRTALRFEVLAEDVDVDRARLERLVADPAARVPGAYPQPGAKAILGYDILPGLTEAAYDRWLWEIHAPDLLANPHLDRIVFNTVIRKLRGERRFFRIAELHFADLEAHARFEAWRAAHPIAPERTAAGRTDFKFYVLAAVEVADRARPTPA